MNYYVVGVFHPWDVYRGEINKVIDFFDENADNWKTHDDICIPRRDVKFFMTGETGVIRSKDIRAFA